MRLCLAFHVPVALVQKTTATGGERKVFSRWETAYLLKHMDKSHLI